MEKWLLNDLCGLTHHWVQCRRSPLRRAPILCRESSAKLRHWPEEETPAGICSVMEAGGGYVTSTFPKAGGCSFFPSYQRAPFLCSPAAQLQITSIFWRGSSICIWCPGFYSRCSGETLMVWLLDYHHPQANTHCSLSETICLSRTFGLRCKFLV